ncbi:glycoside hydrolase family 38 N-terminal domain-containing protein [Bremerella alba]|uniref:Glycoside hydrolase family 38 N-terminal domain-containing protein n=1 Tax=Bremerella alba TaxID=980252 RepID=A0A7V9A7X5_9BACT|nr:hypothetical protein [Bremerella alba]MBA2115718.1 hypothetical protein [Bremerella alba]
MIQEIAILLPCHSFEDFPTYHTGDEAQSILANWTAMWHPAFLASAGKNPQWHRVDSPPESLDGLALLIPSICKSELPAGFSQRAKESGATLVKGLTDRQEIVTRLLDRVGDIHEVAAKLASDFYALGYCYLQVELLTRQMRYSSSLDEIYFENKTIEAAKAAIEGNEEVATECLQACFDVLMEERNQYYSVDASLLDFTLVADSTLNEALLADVKSPLPTNLWISGELATKIADSHPELKEAIAVKIVAKQLGIVGGEWVEGPLNLLDPESLLANFRRGHEAYQQAFGDSPKVFGRRRFGMTAFLPQILRGLGYVGAIHATLDEGKLPVSNQGKARWEGMDGSTIDTLAKFPLDATKPETFLSLFSKLGEAMDGEHVATLAFAHWPQMTSPWYEDLKTIARYGNSLGEFVTVEHYFEETDTATYHGNFKPEDYRTPWLKQSIVRRQEGPVSQHAERERFNAQLEAGEKLRAFAELMSGKADPETQQRLERSLQDPANPSISQSEEADALVRAASRNLAAALPRLEQSPQHAYLSLNTLNSVSTRGVFVSELADLPTAGEPVIASGHDSKRKFAAVDLPGCGYAWITGDAKTIASKQKSLLDGHVLRNEFMEVHIHPETGGIKSIYDYKTRGNRLSQQLSLRMPGKKQATGERYLGPDATAFYSQMQVTQIDPATNSPAMGEIHTQGNLMGEENEIMATYKQTYRLWRASRVLEIDIEIEPQVDPKSLPWDSHYCCRLAWGDETAIAYHDVQWVRTRCSGRRIEASNYVEINASHGKTTLLTAGIPFHLRNHGHMLDTILIPHGETRRKFRLGIGLDLPYSLPAAREFMYQPQPVFESASMPAPGNSSWLFHLEAKNVALTSLQSLTDENDNVIGCHTKILETEGRNAKGALRCFRQVREAHLCDFHGNRISKCKVDGDRIIFQLAPGQWYPLEVQWA